MLRSVNTTLVTVGFQRATFVAYHKTPPRKDDGAITTIRDLVWCARGILNRHRHCQGAKSVYDILIEYLFITTWAGKPGVYISLLCSMSLNPVALFRFRYNKTSLVKDPEATNLR